MKQILILIVSFLLSSASVSAQNEMVVVNWNLEFFGSQNQNPPRQVDKTIHIMHQLQADIYALVEVVNLDSLEKVKNALGSDYDYVVSAYGSLAPTKNSPKYASAQKLVLLYRTSKVRVLHARPVLQSSASAYYNWASGRFPFLVKTEWKNEWGHWQKVNMIVLHGKAMSDHQSCQRRTSGALELKDSIDTYWPNERVILLGDFNDDFDYSICNGSSSNYSEFVKDSTDSQHYFSPTLVLSKQGEHSIEGYSSFLDHVLMTDEMKPFYIPNSADLLDNEVKNWVTNYTDDVSDHFPVLSKYTVPNSTRFLSTKKQQSLSVYPNPTPQFLYVSSPELMQNIRIISPQGQVLFSETFNQKETRIDCAQLNPGLYYLTVHLADGQKITQIFYRQ